MHQYSSNNILVTGARGNTGSLLEPLATWLREGIRIGFLILLFAVDSAFADAMLDDMMNQMNFPARSGNNSSKNSGDFSDESHYVDNENFAFQISNVSKYTLDCYFHWRGKRFGAGEDIYNHPNASGTVHLVVPAYPGSGAPVLGTRGIQMNAVTYNLTCKRLPPSKFAIQGD